MTKARESARNEDCTLRIPGVCSYDPEQTVLAHFGFGDGGTGKRLWPQECNTAYACFDCHNAVDMRSNVFDALSDSDQRARWFHIARGIARTNERRREKGE